MSDNMISCVRNVAVDTADVPRTSHPGGMYYDPKHGGCLRRVVDEGSKLRIIGVYGDDEPGTGGTWTARAEKRAVRQNGDVSYDVDFSGKPSKRERQMRAVYHPARRCITWSDGNEWKQLFVNARVLGHA